MACETNQQQDPGISSLLLMSLIEKYSRVEECRGHSLLVDSVTKLTGVYKCHRSNKNQTASRCDLHCVLAKHSP